MLSPSYIEKQLLARAPDLEDDSCYVIKKIEIALVTAQATKQADKEKLRQMLFDQIDAMQTLNHENIVRVYSSFIENELCHIVMQFCEGGTLKHFIDDWEDGFIPEDDICNWTAQLASAGSYLHEKKLLHRDIKSDNIFLTNHNKTVRLGDFGMDVNTSNVCPTLLGTWAHLAPEVVFGGEYSFESEVWSLGIIVYEMAALRLPFPQATQNWVACALALEGAEIPRISSSYSDQLHDLLENHLLVRDKTKRATMAQIARHPRLKAYTDYLISQAEVKARREKKLARQMALEKYSAASSSLQLQSRQTAMSRRHNGESQIIEMTVDSLAKQLGLLMSVVGPRHYLSTTTQRRGTRRLKVIMAGSSPSSSSTNSIAGDAELQYDQLLEAIQRGDERTVRQLLTEPGCVNLASVNGRNLILEAANYGHAEIVKLLLINSQQNINNQLIFNEND